MMSLAYQSAGGIDSDGRRRSISGGVFYFDTILFPFAYAVPSCLFAHTIRETGRGLFIGPRPVVVVSRSYRRYSGR